MKSRDNVFVVTGAGSGMGRELTIQWVRSGAKIAAVDIHEDSLRETARLAGGQVSIHTVNITDQQKVFELPEQIIQHHGRVDGLVNNAGIIQPFVPVNDLDFDTIRRVMEINFMGMVNMTKAFLPHLLRRPEACIANTSSMGGFIPFPGQTVYSASKAAVKVFTEGLYAELKETPVRVSIIYPGAVQTNIMANSGVTHGSPTSDAAAKIRAMSAVEAAQIILQGIEQGRFRILVGKDARFLDKFYRLSPKMAIDFITRQMSKRK